MDRHTERIHGFSLIYALAFDEQDPDKAYEPDIANHHLSTDTDDELTQYFDLQDLIYVGNKSISGHNKDIAVTKKNKAFITTLYNGTRERLDQIDHILSSNVKSWSLERLNKVDLAILRLAVFEMHFFDTPNQVAINEAVELAKDFSSDEGPKFINGILAGLLDLPKEKLELPVGEVTPTQATPTETAIPTEEPTPTESH